MHSLFVSPEIGLETRGLLESLDRLKWSRTETSFKGFHSKLLGGDGLTRDNYGKTLHSNSYPRFRFPRE